MSHSPSNIKKIENEAVFRKRNEKIQKGRDHINELALEDGQPELIDHTNFELDYICECSDENCVLRITLMSDTYNEIHQNRKLFVIKNGHEALEVETVIQKKPNYSVVEKKVTPPENNPKLHATTVDNS